MLEGSYLSVLLFKADFKKLNMHEIYVNVGHEIRNIYIFINKK